MPETEEECRALKAWAEETGEPVPTASVEQISRHLEFLAATLPSKNVDDTTGKMRFSVYYRMLSGYSDRALAYMSRKVCERHDWFPTPHQCLEILEGYHEPPSPQATALAYCRHFWAERLDNFLDTLKAGTCLQEMIDGVPDQWRRIAAEQGYLRRMPDGSYVVRNRVQISSSLTPATPEGE